MDSPGQIAAIGASELAAPWAVPLVALLVVACSAVDFDYPRLAVAGQFCTVTFGAVVSLSGEHASEGRAMRAGYEASHRSVNRAGGFNIGGKRCLVEVLYIDDRSDVAERRGAIERLATEVAAVDFLLGGLQESTGAGFVVTEQFGIPMLAGPSDLVVGSTAEGCSGATDFHPSAATAEDACIAGPATSAAEQLHAYQLAIEAVGSIDARAVAAELTTLTTEQP